MGNSLRALVVSVEIASSDAIDTLASSLLDGAQVPASATVSAVARFESTVSLLEGRLAGLEREREQDRQEIERLRALVGDQPAVPLAVPVPATSSRDSAGGAVLDDATYVKFEQRFRGAAEVIKERQLDAVRFIEMIAGSDAPLLDLGCGRGEWLTVLRDAGIRSYGVDTSAGMVADALDLGLDARCEDALTHLKNLPAGSLQGVSAFHFAEHVPLQLLTQILDAAFQALRPGGVILLETPNPTNIVVGAAAFYLDPTHLRPIHPDFLQFLVESRGFIDAEVHFVHPTLEQEILRAGGPEQGYDPRLERVVESAEWALFGPQDYVVVARRGGAAA
jgi:SAM-dependent methyltransferase